MTEEMTEAQPGPDPEIKALSRPRPRSVFGRRRTRLIDEQALNLEAEEAMRAASAQIWASLPPVPLHPDHIAAGRLRVRPGDDPVGLLYDHLRTRLLHVFSERNWSRVAICSPTRGCGSTTVAANLALSLARRPSCRTVLMDLDLRHPALHDLFGVSEPGIMRQFLTGEDAVESHFLRIGRNLALGLNGRAERDPAELLQEPGTTAALDHMIGDLRPDAVLFDMPPVLETDDVFGFLPEVDGVVLVADATRTTPAHIRNCEAQIRERSELIGLVLNRAEDSPAAGRRRWI